jgi:hypothetical protein
VLAEDLLSNGYQHHAFGNTRGRKVHAISMQKYRQPVRVPPPSGLPSRGTDFPHIVRNDAWSISRAKPADQVLFYFDAVLRICVYRPDLRAHEKDRGVIGSMG